MAKQIVTGDQYFGLDGKLCEIKRQLRQKDGYPYDPALLDLALQAIIEGRFQDLKKPEIVTYDEFVTPFSREEAITWLVERRKYPEAYAAELYQNWSSLQHVLEHRGPITWKVRAGFTLMQHAPKSGPCENQFGHLKDWSFQDEPTKDCLVFWIPKIIPETRSKNYNEQLVALANLRGTAFPKYHMSGFGSAALLAALIFAEFKRSRTRVPEGWQWIRTDTRRSDSNLIHFGNFGKNGLSCFDHWDGSRTLEIGAFALGVELEN